MIWSRICCFFFFVKVQNYLLFWIMIDITLAFLAFFCFSHRNFLFYFPFLFHLCPLMNFFFSNINLLVWADVFVKLVRSRLQHFLARWCLLLEETLLVQVSVWLTASTHGTFSVKKNSFLEKVILFLIFIFFRWCCC